MAQIIRIKRSTSATAPSGLLSGEVAYSYATGSKKLFIGDPTSSSNAPIVIGGEYYTTVVDAATDANTNSTIVKRSATGAFSAGAITATSINKLALTAPANGATLTLADGSTLALSGGSHTVTFTASGATSLNLPTTGTLVTLAGTEELSNKTLASPTINTPTISGGTVGSLTGFSLRDTSAAYNVSFVATSSTALSGTATITIDVVANSRTVKLGGNLSLGGNLTSAAAVTFNDANATTIRTTGATDITLPTSGTLVTAAGNATLENKTLGTGSSWQGNIISGEYGGTGVNNSTRTITIGGNINTANSFTTSGNYALTLTVGATTNVTLPASGTLATLAGGEELTNKTIGTGSTWQGNVVGVQYGGTGTSSGNITGTGSLTFTAAAGNNNVNLVPTGTGTVDVGSKRITSVADPTQAQDAATKAYVDAVKTGLDVKDSVRASTTAALTATYSNGSSGVGATLTNSGTQAVFGVDNVTFSQGERVLVKNQSTALQNGIYTVTTVGSGATNWVLTRSVDFDNSPSGEVSGGAFVFVEEGNQNADSGWVCTTDGVVTVGTTGITFAQFSGAGSITAGDGLTKSGNTLNVVSADAARITVNADSIDISSNYVGQTSINTVGTLTTGTLGSGFTTVAVARGGTGGTTFTVNGILYGNAGAALGVSSAGSWDSTNSVGELLSVNSSGVPTWTNTIDGGTFS